MIYNFYLLFILKTHDMLHYWHMAYYVINFVKYKMWRTDGVILQKYLNSNSYLSILKIQVYFRKSHKNYITQHFQLDAKDDELKNCTKYGGHHVRGNINFCLTQNSLSLSSPVWLFAEAPAAFEKVLKPSKFRHVSPFNAPLVPISPAPHVPARTC